MKMSQIGQINHEIKKYPPVIETFPIDLVS